MGTWWKTLLGTFVLGAMLALAACGGGGSGGDGGEGGDTVGAVALPERVSVVEDSGS